MKPLRPPVPLHPPAVPLPFLAFLLAALTLVPTLAYSQDYQDQIVIVLDASGSMKDPMPGTRVSKMSAAKEALKTVLTQIPATTHVGLLVFSAKDLRNPWVHPLGPRREADLARGIDALIPYGNTPLGHYIKVGADQLLEARARQFGYGSYRLLLVTDGEAQDQDLVERFTPEVMARGITVDVIGVAMNRDHTLATRVHSYRRANDPEALRQAVAEVLAEVSRERTDEAQARDFELLAALPDDAATAAIQALSVSGNHPIGTTPRGPNLAGAPPVQPVATTVPPPAQVPYRPPPPGRSDNGVPLPIIILFCIFAGLSILKRLARGR